MTWIANQLDADFLSKKYEDYHDEPVVASLVRNEGLEAGISIAFASGGAHTKEVKTYNTSVYGMLRKILGVLNEYASINSIREGVNNKVGWIDGRLFIGHLSVTREAATEAGIEGEILEQGRAFVMDAECGGRVTLVTKDQYFASGYENLLNTISPIHLSFDSRVHCLMKVVGWNKLISMAVGVPYVILDRG